MDTEVRAAPPELAHVLHLHDRGARGRRRAVAFWLAAAALSTLAVTLHFLSRADPRYIAAPVTTGSLTIVVTATGNLQPRKQVEIGSEVSGIVENVYAHVNESVHTGQLLAVLDTARIEAQLLQVEAAISVAEARVAQSSASLSEATAYYARLLKVRELSGNKLPSQQDMDMAEARLARAEGEAAAARAAVAYGQASREAIRTDLAKTEIRSPIDGVVLVRSIEPGQTVAAALQAPVLFTLAEDLRQMELHVALDEADVGTVQTGQAATFSVDASPHRSFQARITRIHLASNQTRAGAARGVTQLASSSIAGGVVVYETVLEVDNPDLLLRPGMTATAEIVTSRITGATLVPSAALRFTPQHAEFPGMKDQSHRRTGMMALMPYLAERWTCPRENGQALGCLWVLEDGEPQLAVFKLGATDRSVTQVLTLRQLPDWSSLSRIRSDPILTRAVARKLRPGMQVVIDNAQPPSD